MQARFGGGWMEKDQQWYLASHLPYNTGLYIQQVRTSLLEFRSAQSLFLQEMPR
jgi:hypothetical protein